MKSHKVRFWVNPANAPYVETKPLHRSQVVVQRCEDGSMIFEVEVVINLEFQRELFGFMDGLKVLSPIALVEFMETKYRRSLQLYQDGNK